MNPDNPPQSEPVPVQEPTPEEVKSRAEAQVEKPDTTGESLGSTKEEKGEGKEKSLGPEKKNLLDTVKEKHKNDKENKTEELKEFFEKLQGKRVYQFSKEGVKQYLKLGSVNIKKGERLAEKELTFDVYDAKTGEKTGEVSKKIKDIKYREWKKSEPSQEDVGKNVVYRNNKGEFENRTLEEGIEADTGKKYIFKNEKTGEYKDGELNADEVVKYEYDGKIAYAHRTEPRSKLKKGKTPTKLEEQETKVPTEEVRNEKPAVKKRSWLSRFWWEEVPAGSEPKDEKNKNSAEKKNGDKKEKTKAELTSGQEDKEITEEDREYNSRGYLGRLKIEVKDTLGVKEGETIGDKFKQVGKEIKEILSDIKTHPKRFLGVGVATGIASLFLGGGGVLGVPILGTAGVLSYAAIRYGRRKLQPEAVNTTTQKEDDKKKTPVPEDILPPGDIKLREEKPEEAEKPIEPKKVKEPPKPLENVSAEDIGLVDDELSSGEKPAAKPESKSGIVAEIYKFLDIPEKDFTKEQIEQEITYLRDKYSKENKEKLSAEDLPKFDEVNAFIAKIRKLAGDKGTTVGVIYDILEGKLEKPKKPTKAKREKKPVPKPITAPKPLPAKTPPAAEMQFDTPETIDGSSGSKEEELRKAISKIGKEIIKSKDDSKIEELWKERRKLEKDLAELSSTEK